ncbi:c-type cytochrome [Aquabacterium sp. J223]|uniref:c-type cytochrome n=1 Tax=Aquabacterium sp. J223 TaxID=2898431 RepID=UPI0021ADBE82|nr:cytochrome c [Aquabacterium sp. J223]UUX96087.1 cytochrome c [Aquabacterium sp. J223]
MKQTLLAGVLAVAGLSAAVPAAAQFQKPEDAVKYRQSAFTVMGTHFGRLGAMANGRVPFDASVAQANADIVFTMSRLPWPAFGEGTNVGNTKAKPEIWSENDKFRAAAQKLQEEAGKLQVAARSGNLDQIKAAFGATAQSCKACHDNYRKE